MKIDEFLKKAKYPLVVVSTLPAKAKQAVVDFLLKLQMPVYAESISGLREDPRIAHLRITYIQELWKNAAAAGYPIDGVLRIGGVPTFRPWRDLEDRQDKVVVCSLSHLPFSGLSGGDVTCGPLEQILPAISLPAKGSPSLFQEWLACDQACNSLLKELFHEEPLAESSLVYFLSQQIPGEGMVYLGNSLPIREWDLAAAREGKNWEVFANRGLNGIDGQISTFFGLCEPEKENWGIFGDLTALYDMAGPWILRQLQGVKVNLVVINNGGGHIFTRMYPKYKEFLNEHTLDFAHLAKFWDMDYTRWTSVPEKTAASQNNRLIEIIPDLAATARFWTKYGKIFQTVQENAAV